MSSPVITTGFGTFGSINLIPTLGFGGGAVVAPDPHGVIVRRGKTKLWPGWREKLEEEYRAEQERQELLKIQQQISVLISERDFLAKEVFKAPDLRRIALAAEAVKVKKQLSALRQRTRMHEKALLRSERRIRDIQEEEDLQVISTLIGELYD